MDTKNSKGTLSMKKRPKAYPATEQQLRMKQAHEACGIRKGMPKVELQQKMAECMPAFFSQFRSGKEQDMGKIKVFESPMCGPCQELEKHIKEGKIETDVPGAQIEVVDVTSDEGFKQLTENNVDAVPMAMHEGKICKILVDEERDQVIIKCNEEGSQPT